MHVEVQVVLEEAKKHCDTVLVLGTTADGDFYAASSMSSVTTIVGLVDEMLHRLETGVYEILEVPNGHEDGEVN